MDRLKIDIANDYIAALSVVSFFAKNPVNIETEIISELKNKYKLKDILEVLDVSKSTYEYRAVNINRDNPDSDIENLIFNIKEINPEYGYRRVKEELDKRGYRARMCCIV